MQDRIKQMAEEAGLTRNADDSRLPELDDDTYLASHEELQRFAQAVAEDCANTSPNELDIRASAGPVEVWTKFRSAIRARYGIKE